MAEQAGAEIEVGADGVGIRFWRAKEGCRHGEARLAAQAASLTAMETRATAILGWSMTLATALVALAVGEHYRLPALAALVPAALAMACCVAALWPRRWTEPGVAYAEIERLGYGTELEYLEAFAQGLDEATLLNRQRLVRFAWWLRGAWGGCVSAPVLAAAAAWVSALV